MKIKDASFIILINDNKLLLYLRDDKKTIPHPAYWSFIGGKIEKGETPLGALEREIKEEIGIEIEDIEFIANIEERKISLGRKENLIYSFKDEFGREITGEVKTLAKKFYSDHVLYFFKGKINKKIEDIELKEGQKLRYFSFNEFKSLKVVPCFKEFIIKNKSKIF